MMFLHHLKHRRSVVALVFVMGAAALTGLITAKPAAARTTAATGPTVAVAAGSCVQRGELTYGIAGAGITALDPNTLSFAGQTVLQTLLYNGLTKYNQAGEVRPDLAVSWRHSNDLRTWWFNLRRGVRYSNGRAFTATDVVRNVTRVLDPSVPSLWRPAIADIRSVRAISPYQVRFVLGSPSAVLHEGLINVKMSDLTSPARLNTHGMGTGPYRVANFVPDQSLTLVPNARFFGPRPCLRRINIVRQPDPTSMVTSFMNRRLDVIWQVPLTSLPAIQANRNATVIRPRTVSSLHLFDLDTSSPPFNDVRARRALSYATDRQTMVRVALHGHANVSMANSLINTQNPLFNRRLEQHRFDLNRAKQLFDAAGVRPGTTFTYWALAGRRDEWITMAQILQRDLQRIGLNLRVERNDITTWLTRFNPAGKRFPNHIVATFYGLPPDPIAAMGFVGSDRCNCNWNNRQFDTLLRQSTSAANPARRKTVFDQMQVLLNREVPVVAIAHQTQISAVQNRVAGVWQAADGTVRLEGARLR
jgi:peptide/nickel transport system substrate-binding protein